MGRETIKRLQAFAAALGWSPLQKQSHIVPSDTERRRPRTVTWYKAGITVGSRNDVFLQINEEPIGSRDTYQAAVYAIRFRIYTGWRSFRLTEDSNFNAAQVVQLEPYLHYRNFDSPAARRAFRAAYPECAGFSWGRIRREGHAIDRQPS